MAVTRRIFDRTKLYAGGLRQKGKPLPHWDLNEDRDEFLWHLYTALMSITSEDAQLVTYYIPDKSEYPALYIGEGVNPNTYEIYLGHNVIQKGRFIPLNSDPVHSSGLTLVPYFIECDSDANYMFTGTVSSIQEISPGVEYNVFDTNLTLDDRYSLSGSAYGVACTLKITSGTLSGQEFPIANRFGSAAIKVLDNLVGLAEGDTFIVKPPILSTPVSDGTTDEIFLVSWFEEFNGERDTDLEDPVLNETPTHRQQLRWCVFPNYGGTPDNTPQDGFLVTRIASVVRDTGESMVLEEHIYQGEGIYSLERLTQLAREYRSEDTWKGYEDIRVLQFSSAFAGDDVSKKMIGVRHPALVDYSTRFFSAVNQIDYEVVAGEGSYSIVLEGTETAISVSSGVAATSLPKDQITLTAFRANASNDVTRLFDMADIAQVRGFDTYSNTSVVRISPGIIQKYGQLWQMPDQYEESSAVILSSGYSIGDWIYFYAVMQPGERTVTIKHSANPPTYDGATSVKYENIDFLASIGSQCVAALYVGTTYPSALPSIVAATIKGGKLVFMNENSSIGRLMFQLTEVAYDPMDMQLPVGSTSAQIVIQETGTPEVSEALATFKLYYLDAGSNEIHATGEHNLKDHSETQRVVTTYDIPGHCGELWIEAVSPFVGSTGGGSSTLTVSIFLKSIQLDFTQAGNFAYWSQD